MPILVFIHGGGWRGSNKSERAFPALPLARAGASFVSVEYPLAPGVALDEMVRQVRERSFWVHRNAEAIGGDPNRIHLAGNSAGGQLGGRPSRRDPAGHAVARLRITGAGFCGGLFGQRRVRYAADTLYLHNEALRLDEETAARLSPLLHLPERGCALIVVVGRDETTEFIRQSVEFFEAWIENGFHGELMVLPKLHHFSIIGELGNPTSPLFQAILNQMGLGPRTR